MERKAYSLRIFSFGYDFMKAIRDEFKTQGGVYKYRLSPHPLNGQIDVQPIPIWYYPSLSGLIPNFSRRRLYMTIAIDPYNALLSYKVIVNLALDLNEQKLGVLAVMQTFGKEITIMADTTSVTYGTHVLVAMKILSKLRKHMDDNGFGEVKSRETDELRKENARLRDIFLKDKL